MARRAVGYIRISQPDEDPENQRFVIERWAREHGYEVVYAPVETYTGEEDPLKRPMFRVALEMARANGIDTIVMTDLQRFSRNYEHTMTRLGELAASGLKLVFINTPIASLDRFYSAVEAALGPAEEDSPYVATMKKALRDIVRSILDLTRDIALRLYAAQGEAYLQEVKMRVRAKMAKLKEEGKVYHRPRLIHYIALWLAGKKEPRELTREDIERARGHVRNTLGRYVELGVPLYRIHKLALEIFRDVYIKFPKAPKSYQAVRRLLEDAGLLRKK